MLKKMVNNKFKNQNLCIYLLCLAFKTIQRREPTKHDAAVAKIVYKNNFE